MEQQATTAIPMARPYFKEEPERYVRTPRTLAEAFKHLEQPVLIPVQAKPEPIPVVQWVIYGVCAVAALVVVWVL